MPCVGGIGMSVMTKIGVAEDASTRRQAAAAALAYLSSRG